jgi:hypothetical protein
MEYMAISITATATRAMPPNIKAQLQGKVAPALLFLLQGR